MLHVYACHINKNISGIHPAGTKSALTPCCQEPFQELQFFSGIFFSVCLTLLLCVDISCCVPLNTHKLICQHMIMCQVKSMKPGRTCMRIIEGRGGHWLIHLLIALTAVCSLTSWKRAGARPDNSQQNRKPSNHHHREYNENPENGHAHLHIQTHYILC